MGRVFLYVLNRQGLAESDNPAKTTKLARDHKKSNKEKSNKQKETIWIFKSLLFAGGDRGGPGGRADEPRLANGR